MQDCLETLLKNQDRGRARGSKVLTQSNKDWASMHKQSIEGTRTMRSIEGREPFDAGDSACSTEIDACSGTGDEAATTRGKSAPSNNVWSVSRKNRSLEQERNAVEDVDTGSGLDDVNMRGRCAAALRPKKYSAGDRILDSMNTVRPCAALAASGIEVFTTL